ncbi:4'-phosphopantetheinyl transferase [Fontibacillus phaseoli]|uniref:4'-phosphopantetheinyl transferase n=1 Tax=Fontibacillus phaseoli TaxID=1416533 RepID=A0A369BEN5_9BACL|nr:4'-phosphopantetheinyl transferase superfamily protein [Fontibacillus phaseoli]RCX18144.1 4'-phosphopantetheinyl transferase [Fontibacillus phaseoli]
MIQVYGVKLEQEPDPLLKRKLLEALPFQKQEKISRFIHRADALRCMTADILSRYMICRTLAIKNSEIRINCNRFGKPLLSGDTGYHFNQSHSGQWVVGILADSPCGIDAEEIREADLGIAEHCFAKQEFRDLQAVPVELRGEYFFDLWTLKESYVKASGFGLSVPLASFAIRKHSTGITLQTEHEFRDCHFKQYHIDPAYKLSVCAGVSKFPEQLELIGQEQLYIQFMNYL